MPAGITTVNFGGIGTPSGGDVVTTVTGQSSILSASLLDAWVVGVATADHSSDEHTVENLKVVAGNIVANTSFDIRASCTLGNTYGLFSVAWAWQ